MKKSIFILLILIIGFNSCKKDALDKENLIELTDIGNNKGNLNGFYYLPPSHNSNLPIVVVLHGCSQTAVQVSNDLEWNKLANKYGFVVLYPEQKMINNSSLCFNWFLQSDNEKEKGELVSIISMIEMLQSKNDINANEIFVTGMSAGAAMTINLLAAYPEVFNAGASLAGMPYKAVKDIFDEKTSDQLGNYIRNQNLSFTGIYPSLMILQGKKDLVVNIENANEIEKQWTNIFSQNLIYQDTIFQYDYNSEIHIKKQIINGNLVYEKVIFDKLGHSVPIDPGNDETQGGKEALFTKDVDYYASYWIANFFGLIP